MKLEYIKKKIVEANPEIVELKSINSDCIFIDKKDKFRIDNKRD